MLMEQMEVDDYFKMFDDDQTGVLDKKQLAALFSHVSGVAPTEEALNAAMDAARSIDTTGDGHADAVGITKDAASAVVKKYKVQCQAFSYTSKAD